MTVNLKNTAVTKGAALLVVGVWLFLRGSEGDLRCSVGLRAHSHRRQTAFDPDSAEELERDVRALLVQRRKIEAVKVVREYTNWGLKASKAFVDALENDAYVSTSEAFPAIRASQPAGITAEVQAQVSACLRQGHMIEAIKWVREATGWGLKAAKDYVEGLR